MKRIKTGWLLSFLAFILVMGMLSGCSSTDSSSDEGKTGDSGQKSAEGDSNGKISGDLEIQYFVGGYGDEWWKNVIKGFEAKYPDVKVKQDAGPNINKKMKTRWISENPPDVVYLDGDGASETQMVEDGQLMDLTDWIKTIKLDDGTSLLDSFIVPPSEYEEGKMYSLPLVFDTWGTWYDKAWFKEQGFDVPSDFQSWMDSMKEIKKKADVPPFITTGKYPQYFLRGVLYQAFAAAGGNELLNNLIDGKEGAWTSDKTLGVMKKVQKMQEAGYIDPGFAALSHTQSQMNFLLHENAYIPVGFWLPNEMEKDVPDGFKFGFIPSPMNDEGTPMVLIPNTKPLAIAKEAKNPEAAKAFVKFAFQKKYAKKFAESTGAMMNMKGVDLASDPNVPSYLNEANKVINSDKVEIHKNKHPMSADLSTPVNDALVSLLSGDIDAKEFCQKAESAAKEYRSSK